VKVFDSIVREEFNKRSFKDNRKKVNRLVICYKDSSGNEFRKNYEFARNLSFNEMFQLIPKAL